MADRMNFPATVEEFMEQYKITDTEQVYTNGIELVPIFRMKQWFEHQSSADVVQVVRCGKCRYCTDNWHSSVYDLCKISGRNVIDTDFCNYGKRREE